MLSERTLRDALARAGLRAPVRFEEVTRSTNETALALAREGAPEWTLVAAGHQTAGRGRAGRTWVDAPGRALLFSLVLRPRLSADRLALLSLLAGTAAAHAVAEAGMDGVGCKWPNDLLVGGGKAGGILAEGRIVGERVDHIVLGVGINLGVPPEGVEGAVAVDEPDAGALLASFLRIFRNAYRPSNPDFATSVVGGYREVCRTLGTRVRASVAGRTVEGEATDVDDAGGLVVETDEGPTTVAFGDVEHLR